MTDIYLELGSKKVVASAVDWPGWCRIGSSEDAAVQLLLDYAPRYGRILAPTSIQFNPPSSVEGFTIVERLPGSAATDFGVPEAIPAADTAPLDADELNRLETILEACWQAFEAGAEQARGKELRKGPRGGGRDLQKIQDHVQMSAAGGYLSKLGARLKLDENMDIAVRMLETRQAILAALQKALTGELPSQGPRGGKIWPPRYMIRRTAWHITDHLWEIEDRVE